MKTILLIIIIVTYAAAAIKGKKCYGKTKLKKRSLYLPCNLISFYSPVASTRRQQRVLSDFESNNHLPTRLPHTVEVSHCSFLFFYSLWFDSIENRVRVYRFSSRRSMHSTTYRFVFVLNDFTLLQNRTASTRLLTLLWSLPSLLPNITNFVYFTPL